jgi:histidine ammonia-lyase
MQTNSLQIGTHWLDFHSIKASIQKKSSLQITEEATKKIINCRNYLDNKLSSTDTLFYGINTGFGFLQNVRIDSSQTEQLQYNLLMSHACGLGEEVPHDIVRLMLLLKIKSLSYGNSGVQLKTVERLIEMYNNDVLPIIYTQGSLGASGDLAPLSHLSLPLIGLGEVVYENKKYKSADLLKKLQWQPIQLQSKEGLALINGTQFMSAYGMYCLHKANHLIKMADLITALSYDAFDCSAEALHPLIHSIRSHKGQVETASSILEYLKGSAIIDRVKQQIQDPYSFRCVPQVHGATKDVYEYVLHVF